MAETKIQLESYVYRNLIKYRNVALPYKCNGMNREELIKHLQDNVGFKVKLRDAIYEDALTYGDTTRKPYLIAEEDYK